MDSEIEKEQETPTFQPAFILVMGVSGSGKSTLGKTLANELHLPFYDADDLHPKHNIEKMSRGEPLTDEDREPWLEIVRKTVEHACVEQQSSDPEKTLTGVVVGCSALKRYYRDILRGTYQPKSVPPHLLPPHPDLLPTYTVFISGLRETLEQRMTTRKGHFMKVDLLDSQLQTLESPEGEEGVVTVRLEDSTEEQVRCAKQGLLEMMKKNKAETGEIN
ncbi:hypothetical protein Clacol_009468 [Clathrus columnatus]|uniref:Gluconokinase n=1 Tax=Clathrus columnatus TaxID=1419009 RepID=A0AAV5AN70_9AGAM|nr:hypothetical protein Clacol_009468 [Clathrus columnatus]